MNIFTVGRIQCLESARCYRSAGKISYKVNPDIRPGRQPHNGDARRDRWVERSTGNVADGKRPYQHGESDRQPIERSAGTVAGWSGATAAPPFKKLTTRAASTAPAI